jgi:glutaminyl-peptide cyclotransferase
MVTTATARVPEQRAGGLRTTALGSRLSALGLGQRAESREPKAESGRKALVRSPQSAVSLTLLAAICATTACDRIRPGPRTAFDGEQALAYARTQVDFGPRVPGTAGHRRAGDWIAAQMRRRADTVIEQRWTHVTRQGDSLPMRNILARFRPGVAERVLYVAHWDTRPIAEKERNLGAQQQPIPGANDGASGVALLIALGDVLKHTSPSVGVDLLFVDGEDYGDFADSTFRDVLIGSQYFAAHLPSPEYRPLFGVVWDMIGDRDLDIYQEGHSVSAAPEVVARVWQTAKELGYERYFIPEVMDAITDDHVPLIRKGLRVIDVIDLNYGPPTDNGPLPATNYHHTLQDTIDKISARSLQIVGDVATTLVTRR